jgi:hypothetical protein
LKVVLFVLNEQLGWQKTEPRRISRSRFRKGVIGKDRTVWHEGTGLSKSTIDITLKRLEDRRVLLVTRQEFYDRTDCFYSINWFWNPCESNDPANESRGRKPGRPTRDSEPALHENRVQRESSEKEIFSKEKSQPAPCAELVGSGIKKDKEIGERGNTSANILHEANPTPEQIRCVWDAAVFATFPTAPHLTWRNREAQALRAYCKQWNENHVEPFLVFLDWCVRHWDYIIKFAFGGLRIAPRLPAPLFLASSKFCWGFELLFAEQEKVAKEMSMTSRERLERQLIQEGYPSDVAARQAEDRLQIGKQWEKLKKERASTQHAREFAKAEWKRAHETIRRLRSPVVAKPESIKVRPVEEIDVSGYPDCFEPYEAGAVDCKTP